MKEIEDIINEAIQTQTISKITTEQRRYIGDKATEITGEKVDIFCNGCILKACYTIYKQKVKHYNRIENEQEKTANRSRRTNKRN